MYKQLGPKRAILKKKERKKLSKSLKFSPDRWLKPLLVHWRCLSCCTDVFKYVGLRLTVDLNQYICPLRWWGAGKGISQISSRLYSSHLSSKTFSGPRANGSISRTWSLWHSPPKIPQFDLLSMLTGQRWQGRRRMSWIQQRMGTKRRGRCADSHGHLSFPPLPWPLLGRVGSGAEKSGNSSSCNPPSRWAPTESCHLTFQGRIFQLAHSK